MEIARNYQLINNELIPYKNGLKYLNLPDDNNKNLYYFFDENGYIYLNEDELKFNYKDGRD